MQSTRKRRHRAVRQRSLVVAGGFFITSLSVNAAWAIEATVQHDGWIAYASAGVPRLQSGDFAVDGDARIGYTTERLGGWLRGRVATYDQVREGPHREQTNLSSEAEGQLWGTPLIRDTWMLSVGADGGFFQYSTDSFVAAPLATSVEDASQIVRLGAVATLGAKPDPDVRVTASVLGGGQREAYIQTTLQAAGQLEDVYERRYSAWGAARTSTTWRFLPDVLSTTLRADALLIRLERSRVFLGFDPATGVTQSNRSVAATRLNLLVRGELGIDVATTVGVAPFVYGQLEWIREAGGGSSSTTTVPSGGLGLKSEGL